MRVTRAPWPCAPGGAMVLAATLLAVLAACASAPRREEPPPRDRTHDPEFAAAAEAAEHEFETQADALAAGVYEPFVPPDSVRPAPDASTAGAAADTTALFGPEEPTTEELLGTLPPAVSYNRDREQPLADDAPEPAGAAWTLQVGAFEAETGALVRLRQLERDFPDLPRWHAAEDRIYRVYLGRFAQRAEAERARAEAIDRGYAGAFVVRAP